MYNVKAVKAAFAEKGTTARKVSRELGINEKTFYTKLHRGTWGIEDARRIGEVVGLDPETMVRLFLS